MISCAANHPPEPHEAELDVTPSEPETTNELIDHPRRIGAFAVAIAAQHAEELCEPL
jgi:hypothetical protein